jgi:hypothetical protein
VYATRACLDLPARDRHQKSEHFSGVNPSHFDERGVGRRRELVAGPPGPPAFCLLPPRDMV